MNFCDYGCGKEATHQFKNRKWCCSGSYKSCSGIKEKKKRTNVERYGVENPSQNKAVQEKRKQTFMEKYGVVHPLKSKAVQEKRKQTNMEKYGSECSLQNKEVQEKSKQSCIEKFGVDNPSKSKEVQEKIKQTCLEKYGVDHSSQSKEVQEKMKQNNLKNLGVEYIFQNKEIQEKIKHTWMEKYGVDNPLKSKEVQEKMKQTCTRKYGVGYSLQNKDVREKRRQTFMEKYGVENYKQSLEAKEIFLKNHSFLCQIEEIKIEDNQFKTHCKNSNCQNSKEKRGWFIPTSVQINNRIAALKTETGNDGNFFYCSQYCKVTCLAFNVHGDPKKNTRLPYTREQYETFRLYVLTRDNYICQFCGEPAIDVHHEIPVKLQPFHAVDPCYGWSCCEKCHYEKGHPQGTVCSTGNLAAVVCTPVKKMVPLKN